MAKKSVLNPLHYLRDEAADRAQIGWQDDRVVLLGQFAERLHVLLGHQKRSGVRTAGLQVRKFSKVRTLWPSG